MDVCCARDPHHVYCARDANPPYCIDRGPIVRASDWLFGLWPGPPQRFEPTGITTYYQTVGPGYWPVWGAGAGTVDLDIGDHSAPGGSGGSCFQGHTYRGTDGEICGGDHNWGATDVEVWYPT